MNRFENIIRSFVINPEIGSRPHIQNDYDYDYFSELKTITIMITIIINRLYNRL